MIGPISEGRMKRCLLAVLAVALGLLVVTAPARAHHSFAAQYDRNKPVTLTGSVTRVEWMNPHVYFYMEVTDTSGKVTNWAIEGGAPNTLYRAGWRKDSLKIGDVVTVEGFLARDGSNLANLSTVTVAGGRRIFGD
jgi:Family of unknown function (DUF6152)